ncbi:hypothetical protein MPLA_1830314 [Mesorhizobium sp. ORS 3359]|nr:hypothetical protein MPLA_1830314 [Mesorhizobium sp. ORS 3359]
MVEAEVSSLLSQTDEIGKMLRSMIRSLPATKIMKSFLPYSLLAIRYSLFPIRYSLDTGAS